MDMCNKTHLFLSICFLDAMLEAWGRQNLADEIIIDLKFAMNSCYNDITKHVRSEIYGFHVKYFRILSRDGAKPL